MEASTAVADPQVKPETRTYFSQNKTYIIPRVKPEERTLPSGKMIVDNKTDYDKFRVEFEGGFFYAKPGDLMAPNEETGELEDVVTYLENHPRFGLEFFLQEQSAPDATEVIMRMAQLVAAQDTEGLAELFHEEQANWGRPQVLEPIKAALFQFEEQAK